MNQVKVAFFLAKTFAKFSNFSCHLCASLWFPAGQRSESFIMQIYLRNIEDYTDQVSDVLDFISMIKYFCFCLNLLN